jgi:hypothetical protein
MGTLGCGHTREFLRRHLEDVSGNLVDRDGGLSR